MGFVQTTNRPRNIARVRVARSDTLGYITTSAINSLVAKVTQQPAPSPTSTTPSVYTTPTGGPTLVAPSPIAPPSSPPIVYTSPVAPPPVQTSPMPPTTFTPPTTGTDQPPPPPTGAGSSSGGGSSPSPFSAPSVDVTPSSSGFLPEVYNADGTPANAPATAATATTLFDKLKALPTPAKIGIAVALLFLVKKGR